MLEGIIFAGLKIFKPSSIAWIRKPFCIESEKVHDMIAISLCPYHGVGPNGVHRNTYGKLIREVTPSYWDKTTNSWYFTAMGNSGPNVQGVLWYQHLLDGSHLAVIEIVGPQSHVSAMQVDNAGEGYFLVGWQPNPILLGLEYVLWSQIGQAVFEEDRFYVEKHGYHLSKNNPFKGVVQWP